MADAEPTKCRNCTAELDFSCKCEECTKLTLGQRRGIGFCHVCAEMYRSVGSEYWRKQQQVFVGEQARIKSLLDQIRKERGKD